MPAKAASGMAHASTSRFASARVCCTLARMPSPRPTPSSDEASRRTPYAAAGLTGGVAGIAAGGFVHSMLSTGGIWFRALETGASVAVVGGFVGMAVAYVLSRRREVRFVP